MILSVGIITTVDLVHMLHPGVLMVPTHHRPTGWEAPSTSTQNSTAVAAAKVVIYAL
jgi:hypothetical protein